jgi:nitroreductase
MDFWELIYSRYSVRAYRPDAILPEMLEEILQAACLAPTAANRQPFKIIVMRTEGRQQELLSIYPREWFVQAPLILAICGDPAAGWVRQDGRAYYVVDAAIAMDHLILAAASLGLGTCWVANFDPAAARRILGLPPEIDPVAFTPLGYPADQPRAKERKSLQELVRKERW